MNKLIWIATPAIFAIIGLVAAYLTNPDTTLVGAGLGCAVGFVVASFAVAGEKS